MKEEKCWAKSGLDRAKPIKNSCSAHPDYVELTVKSNPIDKKYQNFFPNVIFRQAVAGDATLILTNKWIKIAGGSNKHLK